MYLLSLHPIYPKTEAIEKNMGIDVCPSAITSSLCISTHKRRCEMSHILPPQLGIYLNFVTVGEVWIRVQLLFLGGITEPRIESILPRIIPFQSIIIERIFV